LLARPVLPWALHAALQRTQQQRSAPPRHTPGPGLSAAAPARQLAGLRVLLVEDNAINQLVGQTTLERLGASVALADDGQAALAMLDEAPADAFDVVLMDMHMPRMDGLEATRRIRAAPRNARLPVIGMTAAALPEDRALCLQAGMVDHITKPIVVDDLLATLHRWVPPRPSAPPAADDAGALPGFDLAPILKMLRGDLAAVQRLLRSFALQEATAAAEVQALVAQGRPDQAAQRLHRLRGGAATLGAVDVTQAALQAEQALRHQQPAAAELAALDNAVQAALAAITARFGPA
jgi:CheY-like chemotaxis protein/HPt (histidine-containing phosphotransfer) domain-containing protein